MILQPMGPVMFVFDVSETEPLPGAPCLPREVIAPFEVTDRLDRRLIEADDRECQTRWCSCQREKCRLTPCRTDRAHEMAVLHKTLWFDSSFGLW